MDVAWVDRGHDEIVPVMIMQPLRVQDTSLSSGLGQSLADGIRTPGRLSLRQLYPQVSEVWFNEGGVLTILLCPYRPNGPIFFLASRLDWSTVNVGQSIPPGCVTRVWLSEVLITIRALCPVIVSVFSRAGS